MTTARAPLAFRGPTRPPEAAEPAPSPLATPRARTAARGHDLARIGIRPPAAPPATGGAPIQAAGLLAGYRAAKGRAKRTIEGLNKSPRFQKLRAVAGVLGLAGGHRQGYGEHGAEARGAFRGRWEKYFESLPPEKRAKAMARYTLPEREAGGDDVGGGGGGGPEEIEMQELPPRGGGGGGCAAGGGQAAHPQNRFGDSGASGGPCPGGGSRYPQNRFGD